MAYTSLPTVNAGDYWTAANHNTYVKNNFDYIATTRSIMLMPNDALSTTNASDSLQRAPYTHGPVDANATTNCNTRDYLSFSGSATNMGVWNFILPPDFASFVELKIVSVQTPFTYGNDIDMGVSIGTNGVGGAYFSEIITADFATGIPSCTIDISSYSPTTSAYEDQNYLVLYRYGGSTDDTASEIWPVTGINLVYKFYTT